MRNSAREFKLLRADTADDDHPILNLFGRDLQKMSPRQQTLWLEQAFMYWRKKGFPFPSLTDREMQSEFRQLQCTDYETILKGKWAFPSMVGLRLANYFHPQIWSIPVHGRSPLQCFNDDSILRKALRKAFHFWPNRRCWNAQCLRSVMRVIHRARVSNFRPTVARAILARYTQPNDVILDFSAGFGGRLLGCMTLERHYVGIDPAPAQVRGLQEMSETLRKLSSATVEIHQACAETFLPSMSDKTIAAVFSSPPYFKNERYSGEDTQSYRRYPVYKQWKELFLEVVISESYRLLRPGGYLILNISDVDRWPLLQDTKRIVRSLFLLETTIYILMRKMPRISSTRKLPYKCEPVLVLRKST